MGHLCFLIFFFAKFACHGWLISWKYKPLIMGIWWLFHFWLASLLEDKLSLQIPNDSILCFSRFVVFVWLSMRIMMSSGNCHVIISFTKTAWINGLKWMPHVHCAKLRLVRPFYNLLLMRWPRGDRVPIRLPIFGICICHLQSMSISLRSCISRCLD